MISFPWTSSGRKGSGGALRVSIQTLSPSGIVCWSGVRRITAERLNLQRPGHFPRNGGAIDNALRQCFRHSGNRKADRGGAELVQQVGNVELRRLGAGAESRGDLLVGKALPDQVNGEVYQIEIFNTETHETLFETIANGRYRKEMDLD